MFEQELPIGTDADPSLTVDALGAAPGPPRPTSEVSTGGATSSPGPGGIIGRALRLWSEPLTEADALDAFRAVYTDPVLVNGQATDLDDLVARARVLKSAVSPIHHRVESTVVTPGRLAIAFTISGRHVGTLPTPLGEVPATHRDVAVTGLDIFELEPGSGRVAAVWAVADWAGLLAQTDTSR